MPHSINETIRILRSLRGYKQTYMASKMGISQQDYSHLEKHGKKITNDQIILISGILQVSEEFIRLFDPTLFFKQIQQEETNVGIPNVGIPKDLLSGIDNTDEVVIALKAHIIRLLENIHGLRKQNSELNQTIKALRKALLQKKSGVKI